MSAADQTNRPATEFDFSAFPDDTCFHERRFGRDRRASTPRPDDQAPPRTRRKVERRRRVDPTTFEKQYSGDEIEFMNAMQRFKNQNGKAFPSFRDVLMVASDLGYRRRDRLDPSAELPDTIPVPER